MRRHARVAVLVITCNRLENLNRTLLQIIRYISLLSVLIYTRMFSGYLLIMLLVIITRSCTEWTWKWRRGGYRVHYCIVRCFARTVAVLSYHELLQPVEHCRSLVSNLWMLALGTLKQCLSKIFMWYMCSSVKTLIESTDSYKCPTQSSTDHCTIIFPPMTLNFDLWTWPRSWTC